MNNFLSLKTLLRSPVKTILTFLLIAAASFALFSRVMDHAVMTREMNNVVSHYRGVGALNNSVPIDQIRERITSNVSVGPRERAEYWLTDEYIEAFSALPGVSMTDTRYMTAGLSRDHKRIYYEDFGNAQFVIEATFTHFREIAGLLHYSFEEDYIVHAGDFERCACRWGYICGVHVGMPETISIQSVAEDEFVFGSNPYGLTFAESLEAGSRYIIAGSYNTTAPINTLFVGIGSWDRGDVHVIKLDGLPDNFLETEDFAYIRSVIEQAEHNRYAFDIVYTSNMLSVTRLNERNMVIEEGRAVLPEDNYNEAMVCVISSEIAREYDLGVGDKLTFELHDRLFEQDGLRGAVSLNPANISSPTGVVELEIVGVYRELVGVYERIRSEYWNYFPSTVFVPSHLLPVEIPADHRIKPGEFSVVIENPYDIAAFLEKAEPLAEEFGINLVFSDGGWARTEENINTSATMSLLTTVAYIIAAGLALLLATYLYIGRNKKAYAIMRALGTPRRKAGNALALPFGSLSVLAILAGGPAGLIYTSRTVVSALESFSETIGGEHVMDASIPIVTVILCLLGASALLALLTALFLNKMGKTAPLALLQGDVIQVCADNLRHSGLDPEPPQNGAPSMGLRLVGRNDGRASSKEMPLRGKYSALRQVAAYIARHMRRVKLKTAISLILAVVLMGSMGLLTIARLSYQQLYDEIWVRAVANEFSSTSLARLSGSYLTRDFYYSGSFDISIDNMAGFQITVTNEIDRYLSTAFISGYEIRYAEDHDDASFLGHDVAYCILGSAVAEMLGVVPGDVVNLLGMEQHSLLYDTVMSDARLALVETGEMSYDELFEMLDDAVMRGSVPYTVVGIVHSSEQRINGGVFAPSVANAEKVFGRPFRLGYSEFFLNGNENLEQLTDLLERLKVNDRIDAPIATFFIDTAEINNIRRVLDLLITLFPIAVAAAVLIGLTAPGLIIMQSAKEAAILRVLGATKKRVRSILLFEQIVLCVAGLMLTAGGLALYNSGLFTRSAETLAICAALYLSGCICAGLAASASVTRRRVLELLQVKE